MAFNKSLSLGLLLLCLLSITKAEDSKTYRMCVPEKYYQDCLNLLKDPSEAGIRMECISGRDRIDCLDKINQRKADVLASEPEDMYVAYHNKNEDYRVISEIRTQEDKDADFRYEGIILVKKSSPIHSLNELKGAKSCHTGFGRNVGYKIPITKLKNADILKVSLNPSNTATERELKALSEFFTKSCLVGTYSPHAETDRLLKKKYSNLCALCEKPEQCNYPDKFSGYDGAIRCLDKGEGEVAFSKVQYIKKYFGLIPGVTPENSKPEDFEYLCEDGTRRPITGPACSWAQRPWTGYISNADAVNGEENFHNLQHRLEKFFENGLHAENKEAASHLLINPNAVYHSKPKAVEPKEYLERAGYRDVIERDGSAIRKIKWCVQTEAEFSKCNDIRRAAYSRDIRPEITCIQQKDCVEAVNKETADLTVVSGHLYKNARAEKLKPIVYQDFAADNVLVAVVDPSLSQEALKSTPINYDATNEYARKAAVFLNKRRGWKNFCTALPSTETLIQIVHSSELEKYKNKQLLCPDLEKKPVTEAATCHIDVGVGVPPAVFIRETLTTVEQETIKHLFISLSTKFGPNGKLNDVYQLFSGKLHGDNIIFADDGTELVTELRPDLFNEDIFHELECNDISKN